METLLFGSFLTQYDAIEATFKEMKPFLSISGETGRFYNRLVFVLKTVFVVYAFHRAALKYFSLIWGHFFLKTFKNPIFKEVLPNVLVVFLLSTSISSEFVMDIFTLIFSLMYAFEAYRKELQKISSVIFMCLFVQWFINYAAHTEQFRLCTYFKVLLLLLLSYIPMMPNNPKYRLRLTYLYIFMYVWVFYKLGQHYNGCHSHVIKIGEALREKRHTELEPERCKLDDTFGNLDESICEDPKLDEAMQSKFKEGGIYKSKEMTSQSEETHFIERNVLKSIKEASEKENDVTASNSKADRENKVTELNEVADSDITEDAKNRKNETSEINDANFKPQGKKILNGKRILFKRHGEVSKAAPSKVELNEFGSNVKTNDITIRAIAVPKIKPRKIIGSGILGENLANIFHAEKVGPIKDGHKEGTELQIKNHEANKGRSLIANRMENLGKIKPIMKPKAIPIIKLGKNLKMGKSLVNGHIFKKKDFLPIGNDGPSSESDATERIKIVE